MDPKTKIKNLKKIIGKHRYLYHVEDKSEISEEALDSLKKELFDLEEKYPEYITSDSPTQRIGGKPLDKFKKIKHEYSMRSLFDAFSLEDMKSWEERLKKIKNFTDYYIELKFDGLAIELVYKKGILVSGATRGDGKIGEDVTQNIKTIDAIPLRLNKDIDAVIRGEALLTKKEFNRINKENNGVYKNPRNVAAGTIRQLDSKVVASRSLDFYAYDIVHPEIKSHDEKHKYLNELGFKTGEGMICGTIYEIHKKRDDWMKKRNKLPYEIDGIVVQVNKSSDFKELGVVGKAPRGAIAYKFPLSEVKTVIMGIKVQIGRTGTITPVAVLEPVDIDGVTVTRATLHNEDEIKRLGIKIGDSVIVGRAGDVIPDIIKVLPELRDGSEKKFKMPNTCPNCGHDLYKDEGEVVLKCINKDCSEQKRKQIHHFVSRKAFNIEGMGPKIVDQLMDENLISNISDIFSLALGDLIPLERFQEKSANNLIREINNSKEITFPKFIFSLGIFGVGEETANLLSHNFKNIEELMNSSKEYLENIKDIGPETAESIYYFFNNKKNKEIINKLFSLGIVINYPKRNNKLSGKTFVFTGSLKAISRDLAKEKIRDLGGNVSDSISTKTDYLVIGDKTGSKLDKAKKLGIRTINETEFLKLL